MRPIYITLSAAAASTTSLAALQAPSSGVAMTLVASPSFAYAQLVTLTSGANLSAINFTIVGTDYRGVALTETIAGPNINTVSTVNYFKTITRITPNGTSASTLSAGNAVGATSTWAAVDYIANPANIGIGCVVTGTITYTVQHTYDDIFNASVLPTWFDNATIAGSTTNQYASYLTPIRAVRVKQTAGTGSVTMTLLQGDQSDWSTTFGSGAVTSTQTSTTYPFQSTDSGTTVQYTGSGAGAWTLPVATTLGATWQAGVENRETGASANLVITPTTSTINGATSLLLPYGFGAWILSDGANYKASVYKMNVYPSLDMMRQYPMEWYSLPNQSSIGSLTGSAIATGTLANPVAGTITKDHPLCSRIVAAAGANSGRALTTGIVSYRLGGGEVFEYGFNMAELTAAVGRFGWLDVVDGTSDAVDGVHFEVGTANAGGATSLKGVTASNSVRSYTATAATLSISTWYRAQIVLNSTATLVTFYLYNDAGTLLWSDTLSTNIPTASGRETGVTIEWIDTTGGSVSIVTHDHVAFGSQRALAR